MIDVKLIRNLLKNEFRDYLKDLGYKNVEKITGGSTWNDYTPLVNFISQELNKENSLINKENLLKFIYNKLFHDKTNVHYIIDLKSLFGKKDKIKLSSVKQILESNELNQTPNLLKEKHTSEYKLCFTNYNTYISNNDEYLSNLQLIVYVKTVNVPRGLTYMYCCVDIDCINKLVSLKFNGHLLNSDNVEIESISEIKDKIFSIPSIEKLKIVTNTFNQTTIQNLIKNSFIELSRQAEVLLKKETNNNTEEKVRDFLKAINVPIEDDYVKQIISVAYQYVSKTFSKTLFHDGWAFRFVFREGDSTRASSTNTDFEPVYNKKVYWNLKELMFKEKGTDFIEAGLLWNTQNGQSPVIIKLEQKGSYLLVQYYVKSPNFINRKEKERFVLRKIREKLSK